MKSALWSVFRIGVLAIVLIAVPGLKHSANACGETMTEIDYYPRFIACAPEGCIPGDPHVVGMEVWDCDGSYSTWGTITNHSQTFTSVCAFCGPE
jgi:hypothetical protein